MIGVLQLGRRTRAAHALRHLRGSRAALRRHGPGRRPASAVTATAWRAAVEPLPLWAALAHYNRPAPVWRRRVPHAAVPAVGR